MAEVPTTVALLAGYVDRRGEVRRLVRLVDRLARRRVEARVLCLGGGAALMAEGVEAVESPWLAHRWLRPFAARQLRFGEPFPRPDLVHVINDEVADVGPSLATLWRVPLVRTVEDFPPTGVPNRLDDRRCRAVVVGSEELKAHLIDHHAAPPDRIITITPGLDLPADGTEEIEDGPDDGRLPVIGTAGRIATEAGPVVFLDALHRIVEMGRDVEFLVAGLGPAEALIRRRAERLGVSDRLTFAEPATLEGAFWRVLDLYCQPAVAPTQGRSLTRAMALAKPCVGSDVPGLHQVLAGGDRGVIVPPGDPSALARAILELLDRPTWAESMARRARDWAVGRFDPEHEVDALADLYAHVRAQAVSEIGARSA